MIVTLELDVGLGLGLGGGGGDVVGGCRLVLPLGKMNIMVSWVASLFPIGNQRCSAVFWSTASQYGSSSEGRGFPTATYSAAQGRLSC